MPTLLEQISAPDFDIQNYKPLETDSVEEAEEKHDFLLAVGALAQDEEFLRLPPNPITCMVNCLLSYLQCCNGQGNNYSCWQIFDVCLDNCESED